MLGLLCQDLHVRGDVPAGRSSGALLCQYSQPRSVDIQTAVVLAHIS